MNISRNKADHVLDVNPESTVLDVLRQEIGLTGTKYGCSRSTMAPRSVRVSWQNPRSHRPATTSRLNIGHYFLQKVDHSPEDFRALDIERFNYRFSFIRMKCSASGTPYFLPVSASLLRDRSSRSSFRGPTWLKWEWSAF